MHRGARGIIIVLACPSVGVLVCYGRTLHRDTLAHAVHHMSGRGDSDGGSRVFHRMFDVRPFVLLMCKVVWLFCCAVHAWKDVRLFRVHACLFLQVSTRIPFKVYFSASKHALKHTFPPPPCLLYSYFTKTFPSPTTHEATT